MRLETQTMNDIYQDVLKIQEAYAVLHHVPVERQFSNREIDPFVAELEQIEAEIYKQPGDIQ